MKMTKIARMTAITACAVLFTFNPYRVYGDKILTPIDKINILNQILSKVREAYVDSIDIDTLYDGAIQGMVDRLDPHSSYMPPETATDFNEKIRGNFQGIGITFSVIGDKITVIDLIADGPSDRAGLKSRDKIVEIDGKKVIGISDEDVKNRLRGQAGSQVKVKVERPGIKKLLDFTITRARIDLDSVSHAYMLDGKTGYIALNRFSLETKMDMEKALKNIANRGMKQLILDLRNNSGGSLDSAIGVVDLFIQSGLIVSIKGRDETDTNERFASGFPQCPDIPMIVMINHASASASEIVAGALQDHDRALIAGQTSFGKGLVMHPMTLIHNKTVLGTLMLSVAKYYTPSGRLIQRPYNVSREEYIKEGFDDYDPNAAEEKKMDRPVYYTDLGREVYGGGGITPDRILAPLKKLNSLEIELRKTNLFFEFADGYLDRHYDIPSDFGEFLKSYRIPDEEINRFKKFIIEKGVQVDDASSFGDELSDLLSKYEIPGDNLESIQQVLVKKGFDLDEALFQRSIDFIERELKQEIARILWGTDERYKVWHTEDTQLSEALTYFNEASDLLKRRLVIQSEVIGHE